MQIEKNQTIAGQPALSVRKYLREIGQGYSMVSRAMKCFNISRPQAELVLQALISEGLIQQEYWTGTGEETRYKTTNEGLALSLASAAKPLHRKTAERKIEDFLERVKQINHDDNYLFSVSKVILFGSFLSDKQRINDIDLAIELRQKYFGEDYEVRAARKIQQAEMDGRVFPTFESRLFWPHMEVWKFLKSRSRALSLHELATMPNVLDQRVLFECDTATQCQNKG